MSGVRVVSRKLLVSEFMEKLSYGPPGVGWDDLGIPCIFT